MGATLTTISNVLKNFYLGPVRDQLNSKVLALQLLQVDSENLEGLQAVLPLHTSRSAGVGARGELVTLPAAGNQVYAQAVYDLKYHYGRVQVSGQAIAKSASDAGSFLRAMKAELDYIKDDIAIDFARQVYGPGTGLIETCGSSGPSTTLALATAESIKKGFLYIGMTIDVSVIATGAPIASGSNLTITAVNAATPSITTAQSLTVTSANGIYRAGNVVNGPVVYEMDAGLQKILATAANSLGGINAASAGNEYWDNLRNTTGGAIGLTSSTIGLLFNLNQCLSAGASDVIAVTTPGLVRQLFASADFANAGSSGNVRFVNTKEFKGGFSTVSFDVGEGPVTLASDRHAPWGKVFLIDRDHIKLFSPGDWDFMQRDGLTIRSMGSGASAVDAYEAVLFRYANMGADRRNSSLVANYTDTTGN